MIKMVYLKNDVPTCPNTLSNVIQCKLFEEINNIPYLSFKCVVKKKQLAKHDDLHANKKKRAPDWSSLYGFNV